jgi:hypothetical protein
MWVNSDVAPSTDHNTMVWNTACVIATPYVYFNQDWAEYLRYENFHNCVSFWLPLKTCSSHSKDLKIPGLFSAISDMGQLVINS